MSLPCTLWRLPPASAAPALRLIRSSVQRLHPLPTLTHFLRSLSFLCATRRSVLLAPASPRPKTFASTHAFRNWDPSLTSPFDQPEKTKLQNSTRVVGDNEEDELESATQRGASSATVHIAAAMSYPYSARAYRSQLQHGNFSSLRQLARAAYAPSPLSVLIDLLRLSVAPLNVEVATPSSKTGVRHALERALDVQWVLHATAADARDTVLAAETIGDAATHTALRELLDQIDAFVNAIDDCVRGAPKDVPRLAAATNHATFALPPHEGARQPQHNAQEPLTCNDTSESMGESPADDASPAWTLPASTHAILLRGVLQLAALTGAHLHALSALDELIALQERRQRSAQCHPKDAEGEEHEGSFSLDDALALVDATAQRHVAPLTALDHLYAMQACANERHRDFRTTLSLYRRFVQHVTAGRFAATPADFTEALVALAHSSRNTTDFIELRALLVESEAAAAVPVSVPLYTALIDAASRAVEEPQRMSIALSLYHRLRDGALTPTADTYAALIACCASTREPTHAFAFYHEARQVCGVANFTPRVYTNLLLSYATAGYGADARKTLDVLVEAGAPLTRASFHAALASAVTVREAQEIVTLMTERYHIAPTPHTYAYVVQAMAKAPAGSTTALQLFDVHEETLRALADISAAAEKGNNDVQREGKSGEFAVSTTDDGVALEPMLLERYPLYVRALEHALIRLRVDPTQDPRLKAYLTPLVRVAQQRMNLFTGMPPQSPIRVPDKEGLFIAVLAADVLANVDEWVVPFMSHLSVLVIPYSALLSLQQGGGRRVEGATPKGPAAGLYDLVWQETAGGSEHEALAEHRRRRLMHFVAEHRDVVHLVSLEEELKWSRETRRYGVGITDLFARAAAIALHLARRPEDEERILHSSHDTSSVYARHPNASIVLMSTNYEKCGKYVVALKTVKGREVSAGLQAALRRVTYHNPRTNPNWVPPSLSITRQQEQQQQGQRIGEEKNRREEEEKRKTEIKKDAAADAAAVGTEEAASLYRRLLHPANVTQHQTVSHKVDDRIDVAQSNETYRKAHAMTSCAAPRSTAETEKGREEEEDMDAALLMSILSD